MKSQKVIHGLGCFGKLGEIISSFGVKRLLVVTGNRSFSDTGIKERLDPIIRNIKYTRFFDFRTNPKFEDASVGASLRADFKPDAILGIGGGSVIDMAKLCRILPDSEDTARRVIRGEIPIETPSIPLIAVPTTAGSGSEATHFAVVYIGSHKYSVAASPMLPDAVVLDPELTYTMPSSLSISSAWDALSQAIESYWARNASSESRQWSIRSIRLCRTAIPALKTNPTLECRSAMMEAAHLAGKAINVTKTTAPHALSYAFTIKYGLSHGHAVAMTLSEIYRYHVQLLETKTTESGNLFDLEDAMFGLYDCLGDNDQEASLVNLERLLDYKHLSLNPRVVGVKSESELVGLLGDVNVERLSNHPVVLDRDALVAIMKGVWNRG